MRFFKPIFLFGSALTFLSLLSALPSTAMAQPATPRPLMPPLPPTAPSPPGAAPEPAGGSPQTGFTFGSYGRIGVASDLRGHTGQQANIVAHGPRTDAPPYAELQFAYDGRVRTVRWRAVITLGVNDKLFHFNGNFDGAFAIRNLYLETRGAGSERLSFWVGSRMYRGDDVYLLNWWPLDNLNMVGGGTRLDLGTRWLIQAAVGMNRLDDPYQLQTIQVAPRDGLSAQTAYLLDRPRVMVSAKATFFSHGRLATSGLKLSLYGEAHAMASGVRQVNDAGARVELPADQGFVLGAQAGLYRRANFLNLFVRYGQGLGAYGDLRVPATLASARTAARAEELTVALAGNYEFHAVGIQLGAYYRYFRDADPGVFSRNALQEAAVVVRPLWWITDHFGFAGEVSWQTITYNALDPVTGNGALRGTAWRFAAMPFVSPMGRGSYTRPHLRLVYIATVRDDGARRLYAPDDPMSFNPVEHYLGVNTEWWFNSSYL